ncbi:DUF6541 family protein [Microbacterium aquimaris]|uniref:DUF6541 family protein n=1 Tax=Microbacterium aquimaris TaxID=459816 RepID=A0ABU5N654_9MICO|nr:DUF6541 family protein [Microbacterium aquimaris]MDZ8161552.1 DUF6541 family protein [Microbacterium aquimaris]
MVDAAWWSALPAVLVAVAVILVPGFIGTWGLPVGVTARVALAGPFGVVAISAAGAWSMMLGVNFALWQPAVTAVLIGLLVYLLAHRVSPIRASRSEVPGWTVYALSIIAATVLIGTVAFIAVPGPESVSQTYDNVFHMSAIASILADGNASSFSLRTLIETDRSWSYYPAGWHSIVALTALTAGVSAPVAVNATWLGVCATLWVPGTMWLTRIVTPVGTPAIRTLIAAPLAAAFGAMPYSLLSWGTLYPTFLATALLPAAIAAPVAWWRTRAACRGNPARHFVGVVLVTVTCLAIAFAQPRVLVSWGLILFPFAVAVAARAFRAAVARGGRAKRLAWGALAWSGATGILVVLLGFTYAVFGLGLFDRPLEERLGGPQAAANQSVGEGLWQVLSQTTPTGVGTVVTTASPALAIVVLMGAVVTLRRRGARWLVVSAAIVSVLFALAAGSDDVLTKLATGLWYKDRYRLLSLLPIMMVPLAAVGISAIVGWLARNRTGRARAVTAITVAWVVAVASAISLAVGGMSAAIGSVYAMPTEAGGDRYLSRAQAEFFEEIDAIVPEGQLVLGDPWDGSAWSWVYGSREPVFPHLNGQWDDDRLALAWRLDAIEDDPAVCRALQNLNVQYVLYSAHDLGDGDPAGNHFPAPHRAVEAGLFDLVATSGETALYRIPQCD